MKKKDELYRFTTKENIDNFFKALAPTYDYDKEQQKIIEETMKYTEEFLNNMNKAQEDLNKESKTKIVDKNVLHLASDIINGDRKNTYGKANDSFKRIADYWTVYLQHKYGSMTLEIELEITPNDVAMLMVLFKLAREENKHHKDNIVDMCGYLQLYNDLTEG